MPFAVNRDPEGFFMLRSHLKKARSIRAAKYFMRASDLAAPSHLSVGSCFPRAELESGGAAVLVKGINCFRKSLPPPCPDALQRHLLRLSVTIWWGQSVRSSRGNDETLMQEGAVRELPLWERQPSLFLPRELPLLPRSGRSCWFWTWEGTLLLQTSC